MSPSTYRRVVGFLLLVCTCVPLQVLAADSARDPSERLSCLKSIARSAHLEPIVVHELLRLLGEPLRREGLVPEHLVEDFVSHRFLATTNPHVVPYLSRALQNSIVTHVSCSDLSVGECRDFILRGLKPQRYVSGPVDRSHFLSEIENLTGQVSLYVIFSDAPGRPVFPYRELIRDIATRSGLSLMVYSNSEALLSEFMPLN